MLRWIYLFLGLFIVCGSVTPARAEHAERSSKVHFSGYLLYTCDKTAICLYVLETQSIRKIAQYEKPIYIYGASMRQDGTIFYAVGKGEWEDETVDVFSFHPKTNIPKRRFTLKALHARHEISGIQFMGFTADGYLVCEEEGLLVLKDTQGNTVKVIDNQIDYDYSYDYDISPSKKYLLRNVFSGYPQAHIYNFVSHKTNETMLNDYIVPISFIDDTTLYVGKSFDPYDYNASEGVNSSRRIDEAGSLDLLTKKYTKIDLKRDDYVSSSISCRYMLVQQGDGTMVLLHTLTSQRYPLPTTASQIKGWAYLFLTSAPL